MTSRAGPPSKTRTDGDRRVPSAVGRGAELEDESEDRGPPTLDPAPSCVDIFLFFRNPRP